MPSSVRPSSSRTMPATPATRFASARRSWFDVEGDEERYTIVGAIEAKPAQGLISNESPVGRALLGLRPGEEAVAMAPHGQTRLRVIRIER